MEEKRADDRRIENKEKTNSIDNEIKSNNIKLNCLDEMEENFETLKNEIDESIELLSHSIKGKGIKNTLTSIAIDSSKSLSHIKKLIGDNRDEIKSNIRKLTDQKESLEKEEK